MKKNIILVFLLFFISSVSFAGRKEGPKLYISNQTETDLIPLTDCNGKPYTLNNYNKSISLNNDVYFFSPVYIINASFIKIHPNQASPIVELLAFTDDYSDSYNLFDFSYEFILLFSENGSLVHRIDDITDELVVESSKRCTITITETAPIGSVPLNYPAIPESYCTDSYYITNNTDELVYVVAPDYIGVPHPDAGTLEEGESLFIPSGPLTNGLYFYRALYPGESFYLGKEAHPYEDEYSRTAAERFNQYLPLIYLVTPEMNVLYRLENFENYEFSETETAEGKKVFLELQEEMSMRHTAFWDIPY